LKSSRPLRCCSVIFLSSFETESRVKRDVLRELSSAAAFNRILYFIAYVVGGIMAVGAIFAALNSMYSAVSARTREIATLRATGFGALAVIGAVITEAVLLALLGSALGAALIGIAGGSLPALHAARVNVAQALRAL
jgi:putative ABC transport system permease protein